jgi:flagellin-like hook-associated protein FlgL
VIEAKVNGDKDVDSHLKDLAAANQDMQNRFGSAINNVKNAQKDVDNAQSELLDTKRNNYILC